MSGLIAVLAIIGILFWISSATNKPTGTNNTGNGTGGSGGSSGGITEGSTEIDTPHNDNHKII
jgi:hypothetical protein